MLSTAKAGGLDPARARDLAAAAAGVLSLDHLPDRDAPAALGDLVADPEADVEAIIDRLALRQAIATLLVDLPPMHLRVRALRYGLDGEPPRDRSAVAAELGIRRDQVRRIEAEALRLLRRRAPRELAAA